MSFTAHLLSSINVTGPILLIVLLGYGLRRAGLLDESFVTVGNRLVFNVGLPCLLFLSVATSPLEQSLNLPLVSFAVFMTLAAVAGAWLLSARWLGSERRGVFVQCSFRGNIGIVGLALCLNAYGQPVLAKAGVYLAVLTVVYNLVSVALLSSNRSGIPGSLLRNPLLIGVFAGLGWSYTGIVVPELVHRSASYLAQLSLPVALLCIGASLSWTSLNANRRDVLWATGIKLLAIPLVVTLVAIGAGFRGEDLGILFLMMSAPAAAAGYVMARQMTRYGAMAAEIVALSTVMSPISISVGYFSLSLAGMF